MRSRWSLMFVAALGLAPWCWSADKAAEKTPEDKAEDVFYGNRMIVSALEAEVKGDFAARERLLKEAAALEAAPAAQAHLGLINVGEKKPEWKTIDESMSAAAKDDKLLRYEKVRRQSPDTADGHLAMAKWCLSGNLDAQGRAHLSRVLDFAPDHAGAREALGFVRLGDKWLSPAEIERMQLNAAAKTKSIEKHGKTIAAWIEKMKSKSPKEREAALAAFMAFKEVTAVGAVEAALNTPDVPTSKLLIEWMGQVDCVESSLVLARYGVLHPDDALRTLATEKLVKRPLHDFVPEMLKLLSSPITMLVQPNYDRQGRLLGYRQAFGREGMSEKDVKIFDNSIQRRTAMPVIGTTVGANGGMLSQRVNANATAQATAALEQEIRQQAAAEVQARQLEMQRQNELIKQVNERIAGVIAQVSGKPLTTDVAEMWKWWDEYNETEYQSYKPDRYRRSLDVAYYVNPVIYDFQPARPMTGEFRRVANPGLPSATWAPRIAPFSGECFVAGTPVVTLTGLKAIEKIVPGDLVLSRQMITGELRWQPVLKATMRAPEKTLDLTIGSEDSQTEHFRCTAGHLFWVSGSGWKKASELKPGDILHGAKAPARVTFVEAQPAMPTYNLEVADHPNYFVGRNMILTHDVTPRETNRQTFPGQEMVRQLSEQRPVRKTVSR